MHDLILLAERLQRPLLAEPWAAAMVLGVLGERIGVASVAVEGEVMPAATLRDFAQDSIRARREYRVEDGVAIVPVIGSLASRSGRLQPGSGLTGYSAIGRAVDDAAADADVGAIALEIDSSGGEAAGTFDLARHIRAATARKPVWAIVDETAFSAAYAIASAAGRIVVPRTGQLGSIGVIAAHVDLSGKLAQEGRRVTLISSGRHKADGNPFGPLPADVAARYQASIDELYEEFAQLVAANRGLAAEAVRATEALTYFGPRAAELGLADAVMPARQALAELKAFVNGGRSGRASTERVAMTTNSGAAAPAASAELAAARAAGHAEGLSQGRAEGAAAERARIGSILGAPEAEGREVTARQLALATDMAAPAVTALLGTLPKATPPKPAATDLAAAMAGVPNPQVGADAPADDEVAKLAARIASYA